METDEEWAARCGAGRGKGFQQRDRDLKRGRYRPGGTDLDRGTEMRSGGHNWSRERDPEGDRNPQ